MKRKGYGWAKIRGAYRLSRRSIARIVAAISAAMLWFHTSTADLTPADEALNRRAFNALCVAFPLADSMPPTEVHVAVSDHVFAELADVFFNARPYLVAQPKSPPPVAGLLKEDRCPEAARLLIAGNPDKGGGIRMVLFNIGKILANPDNLNERGLEDINYLLSEIRKDIGDKSGRSENRLGNEIMIEAEDLP